MKKYIIAVILIFATIYTIYGQGELKTVAEATNYESTSRYEDVMKFIKVLEKASPYIRTETIAITEEGREVPLMIIANPMPESPKDLINDSRIVVYVQANIHAGEVEGKEAVLMFARDLLSRKHDPLLKRVVVLICPDFNADGNEKISTQNRINQNGPKNGVGVRHNGAFLDLNRDALKAESPEVKGLITNVFNRWDPAIFMDCHTTNGIFRQEPVTFNWMMNPNGDKNLIHYMRDKMMPTMSQALKEKYHVENCYYGEFEDLGHIEDGYISYAHEPRYLVNYVGIRNRLAILNENYVYADFKSRVLGSYSLIHSLMEYVYDKKDEIKALLKASDELSNKRWTDTARIDSFSFDYRVVPIPEQITIKIFESVKDTNSNNYMRYKPTDVRKTLTIPYLADYVPNKSITYPYAYIISIPDKAVLNKLKDHGIKVEKLSSDQTFEVERFEIKNLKGSDRLNQGHYTNSIEGEFVPDKKLFPAGTYLVRTSQQLAAVVAYLLEPQSGDGLLFWNFFDRYLVPQWGRGFYPYPVYRLNSKTEIKSVRVN